MFDQTFVEATLSDKKPITLVFSLMLQAFAICLLTLIPLLYTEVLPGGTIKSLLVAPATPPAAIPKPSAPQTQPKLAARTLDPRTLLRPWPFRNRSLPWNRRYPLRRSA
jgi:hypothetical protein